jgi:probable phosphoglycerate mutase
MMTHTTEIYLGRHGQTTGDEENRFGGIYDDDLTELGHEQAGNLAEKLSHEGIQRIYSSELKRASQTACEVGAAVGLSPVPMKEFNERNAYAHLSGMTLTEAMARFPEDVVAVADHKNTIEGAETYEDFLKRVTKGLGRVSQLPEYRKICVITHGGVIRATFRDILNVGEVEVDDCAVFKLIANVSDSSVNYGFEYMNGITPRIDDGKRA